MPVLLLFAMISVTIISADDESSTLFTVAVMAGMTVLLAVLLLFSRLEVTVSGGPVVAAFGFGWPRRVIELGEVTVVRQVRNPWWYGWGLRKVPHGWMYNVWGLDAVEFDLSSGKVFRIGTDQPEELFAVLSLQVTT